MERTGDLLKCDKNVITEKALTTKIIWRSFCLT